MHGPPSAPGRKPGPDSTGLRLSSLLSVWRSPRRLRSRVRVRASLPVHDRQTLTAQRANLGVLAALLLEKEVVDWRMLDDLMSHAAGSPAELRVAATGAAAH